MKYIDAEKLIAEIERLIKANQELKSSRFTEGIAAGYGDVLSAITSLQQEQPEVDIDDEIDKFMFAPFQNFARVSRHCLVDMGDGKEWVPVSDWKITTYKRADAHFLRKIARHFYDLGLKARKEEEK